MKKRLLRAVLALSAALMLTVPALAAEGSATPPAIPTEGDVWDGTTQALTAADLVDVDGTYYYEIKTCEQLAFIAETGGDWLTYNYILANNLILNDVVLTWDEEGNCTNTEDLLEWTPIPAFTGKFKGENYIISGLYIDSSEDKQGLFRSSSGRLSGITVTNSYVKGNDYVGGIIGNSNNDGFLESCTFSGVVSGNNYCGGIVGINSWSTIKNLTNFGDVLSSGSSVGGITGSHCYWSFSDCFNYGNITSTGNCVGGLIGKAEYNSELCRSANYGSVSGINNVGGFLGLAESSMFSVTYVYSGGSVSGSTNVGGIVGGCAGSGNTSRFWLRNSYNAGAVSGNLNVGGLQGREFESSLKNCYSIGTVTGNSVTGGIAGESNHMWSTSLNGCYFLKDYAVNETVVPVGSYDTVTFDGHAEPKNSAELQNQSTFVDWDFNKTWSISPDKNGGYPYLKWQEDTISDVPLTGVSLSASEKTIAVGDVIYLTANHSPATATAPDFAWSSSDTSVLKVSQNGRIEAVGAGTATITLSGGGFSDTCTVTVEYRTPTDYRLNSLTARTMDGDTLSTIPAEDFWANLSLTKLAENGNVTVLLAAYDADGRFVQLLCAAAEGLSQNQSVTFSLYVDNSDGKIASLKAFAVSSLSNLTPLCAAIEF